MKELFALKYKPTTLHDFFKDVEEEDDVSTEMVLQTLLDIDDINILFVGNMFCGKTVLLNILIREYYNLKKDDPLPENNILYINNLKEQGISFFRTEMKTHSQSRSSIFGKKKMIVIDDIDTINEQSQQTFRNYIDKYKHNIHFVSVCTNIQKVIESFQSRVHIIKLQSPTTGQLLLMYNTIVNREDMMIAENAKHFLLQYCDKSIRSLLNQMEKMSILGREIDLDTCIKLCMEINYKHFEHYFECLRQGQLHAAIKIMYDISDLGYSVVDIYDYLFHFVKTTQILNDDEKYFMIPLFCKYITSFHNVHEEVIELSLFTNRIYIFFQAKMIR